MFGLFERSTLVEIISSGELLPAKWQGGGLRNFEKVLLGGSAKIYSVPLGGSADVYQFFLLGSAPPLPSDFIAQQWSFPMLAYYVFGTAEISDHVMQIICQSFQSIVIKSILLR